MTIGAITGMIPVIVAVDVTERIARRSLGPRRAPARRKAPKRRIKSLRKSGTIRRSAIKKVVRRAPPARQLVRRRRK